MGRGGGEGERKDRSLAGQRAWGSQIMEVLPAGQPGLFSVGKREAWKIQETRTPPALSFLACIGSDLMILQVMLWFLGRQRSHLQWGTHSWQSDYRAWGCLMFVHASLQVYVA